MDESVLREHVDWLVENGVHSILARGGTGEFAYLRESERRRTPKVSLMDMSPARTPSPGDRWSDVSQGGRPQAALALRREPSHSTKASAFGFDGSRLGTTTK